MSMRLNSVSWLHRFRSWLILLTVLFAWPSLAREIPFGPAQQVGAPVVQTEALASADLNRDGHPDLVTVSHPDQSVTWWENLGGTGGWTEHLVADGWGGPLWADAADLDGDGDPDLMVVDYAADQICWAENMDGAGSSWTRHVIGPGHYPAVYVTAADIDNDGDLDVVGGDRTYSITWWENLDGDGSNWRANEIDDYGATARRNCVDMNRDGWVDILAVRFGAYDLAWYQNPGDSGNPWIRHGVDPYLFKAIQAVGADFDGDGDLDVMATSYTNWLTYYENLDGQGTYWTESQICPVPHILDDIVGGDVDGDGDIDVYGTESYEGEMFWVENDYPDWTKHTVGTDISHLCFSVMADFDSDGDQEFVGATRSSDVMVGWDNLTIHRSAVFPHSSLVGTPGAAWTIPGDLDRDGDLDLVTSHPNPGGITWWENDDGQGQSWTGHNLESSFPAADQVFTFDLDRDGDLDVLGSSWMHTDAAWWENADGAGTSWSRHDITSDSTDLRCMAHADLNRDGAEDVILGGQDLAWFESDGTGMTWTQHPVPSWGLDTWAVLPCDLDRDGDVDLVAGAARSSIQKTVWLENSSGDGSTWVEHDLDDALSLGLASVDMDEDGDPDLLAAMPGEQTLYWFENQNDAAAWDQHELDTASFASRITAADVDGDGDPDVLGGDHVEQSLTYWENLHGDASVWMDRTIDDPVGSVAAGDIDGDGLLDIIGVHGPSEYRPAWWRNRGGQIGLRMEDTTWPWRTQGHRAGLLDVNYRPRAREGDGIQEWAVLKLYFQDGSGVPLTSAQANAIFEYLTVERLSGAGSASLGPYEIYRVDELVLDPLGGLTLVLEDGDPNTRIENGWGAWFFLSVELTEDAAFQDPNQFRVSYFVNSPGISSLVENRDFDLPTKAEYYPDFHSGTIQILAGTPTPTPFVTPVPPTSTPSQTPTRTPTPTRSPTPSGTITPPPTPSPTEPPSPSPRPTSTPTAVPPTATETAEPTEPPTPSPTLELGVRLELNGELFHSGDPLVLTAHSHNPGPDGQVICLVVLLDVLGEYFIWPSWAPLDTCPLSELGRLTHLSAGEHRQDLILDFLWPEAPDLDSICFLGALLNPERTAIVGIPDLEGNCCDFRGR